MKTYTTFHKTLVKQVLAVFIAALVLSPMGLISQTLAAGALTTATDTLSNTFRSNLEADVSAGATTISVTDGSGFVATDKVFITDGTNGQTLTVSAVTDNDLTVNATAYAFSSSDTSVTVLTGIKHAFSFDAGTTATIDTIRFTFSAAAVTDGASFVPVTTFTDITGVTGAAAPQLQTASTLEFDATSGSITAGTTITLSANDVQNPTGSGSSTYYIDVETINAGATVIDTARIYFFVDNGHVVKGNVNSTLTATIDDNGTDNNPVDLTTDPNITFDALDTTTEDSAATGQGVDGNLITVTTNATNGYTVTIQDTTNGLVNANFVGAGRPSGATDDGIDDITGGPAAFPGTGTEAYAYSTGATFDSAGAAVNYTALTASPVTIKTTTTPITSETTFVTFRAQTAVTTPAGVYTDLITYIITPNF